MLSKIMMGKPNVLLIDEPTNHLDLESITAFNNSLINFKGTVLFSTNDRAFAESVANRIIEITPNGIIDSYLKFNEYILDDKILSLREKLYS
jgi:ATPase subunit of ABC transporter with duplicated ATPase domains